VNLQKYDVSYHISSLVLVSIKCCCKNTVLIGAEHYCMTTSHDFSSVTYETLFG
jgi:hypothetical protein